MYKTGVGRPEGWRETLITIEQFWMTKYDNFANFLLTAVVCISLSFLKKYAGYPSEFRQLETCQFEFFFCERMRVGQAGLLWVIPDQPMEYLHIIRYPISLRNLCGVMEVKTEPQPFQHKFTTKKNVFVSQI